LLRPIWPVWGFAPDQIGFAPIGRESADSTCRKQVLWSFSPPGSVAGTASDSIASKILRSPMWEIENSMPVAAKAWWHTLAASVEEGTK